ncbi:hypothetical protein IGI50_001941 [Enterococcus sp. DIV0170]
MCELTKKRIEKRMIKNEIIKRVVFSKFLNNLK